MCVSGKFICRSGWIPIVLEYILSDFGAAEDSNTSKSAGFDVIVLLSFSVLQAEIKKLNTN